MNAGVVVADDDPDILRLVGIAVGQAGLDLLASELDGDAALAAIREHRPAVAVLDCTMPGLTGVEVCRAVRDDPTLSGVTIIMLSASVDETTQRTALTAGADHFHSKPFSPRDFATFLSLEARARG